jgi:hypothetical protein
VPIGALVPRAEAIVLRMRELLSELRGVIVGDALLLQGPSAYLPWTPNIRYFGRAPQAPSLLLPTQIEPTLPLEVFERCVRKRYDYRGQLLIDAKVRRVVGLPADRPLTLAALEEFLR